MSLENLHLLGLLLIPVFAGCQTKTNSTEAILEQNEVIQPLRLVYDTIDFISQGTNFQLDEADLEEDSIGWISVNGNPFPIKEIKGITLVGVGFNSVEIKTFPKGVLKFTNLKYLYLGMRGFETIPDEISNLSNLEVLDLQHSSVRTLPNTIGKLKNLREIILLFCPIETLPDNFSELTGLRKLHLGCTSLAEIPPPLFKMKRLKQIILTRCEESEPILDPSEVQRLRDSLPNTAIIHNHRPID